MRKQLLIVLASVGFCLASPCYANWTLNLGYHNPMNAHWGLNFLYWGSQWNFEVGIGWVDADVGTSNDTDTTNTTNTTNEEEEDDTVGLAIAGDINLKYRFTSGAVTPYIQVGLGAWTAAAVGDNSDANADLGGPFAGLGLMFGKPNFYVYAAYNVNKSEDGQFQAGLGFDI